MLCIDPPGQIWQSNPPDGHDLASGWRTTNGYLREAKQLSYCLRTNARLTRPYPLEAVVKFAGDMTPDEHNTLWRKYTRNMRAKGITAFWTREPTRSNRIHYHLLIVAPEAAEAAQQALETACPPSHRERVTVHVDAVVHQNSICPYIVKAKVKGIDKTTGRWSNDKWAYKRLLFCEWVKLDKYGSVGPFWSKPKQEIWAAKVERERGIKLYRSRVWEEARRLHALVGDYIPRHVVERNLAWTAWRAAQGTD